MGPAHGIDLSSDGKLAIFVDSVTNCGCSDRAATIGGGNFFPSNIAPHPYGLSLVGVYDAASGTHLASWSTGVSQSLRGAIAFTSSNEIVLSANVRESTTFGAVTVAPPAAGQYSAVILRYSASGALLGALGGGNGFSYANTLRLEGGGLALAAGSLASGTIDLGAGSLSSATTTGWLTRFTLP